MAFMGTVQRHWVCPKCTAAFIFSQAYFKGFRAYASADVARQIAEKRIRHRQLGCANDRPGWCFLTSACVGHLGLADDCRQLEILRSFRDHYLLTNSSGQSLVDQYYRIAPLIVQQIEATTDSSSYWKDIFESLVEPSVRLIEQGSNAGAEKHYKEYVLRLASELNIPMP